jgi:hypothetical protein
MLTKHTFRLGWSKMSDETKVQFLFAVKSAIVVWIVLSCTDLPTHFGWNTHDNHIEMSKRLNKLLILNNGHFAMPVEVTYTLMAILAALISFSVVQISINFAYFFFSISRNIEKIKIALKEASESNDDVDSDKLAK